MNIIITGGAGLIGKAFAKLLLSKGHKIWILTRQPGQISLPEGAVGLKWDGSTPSGWQNEVERADAIVNLEGENIWARRWNPERKDLIRSSRVKAGLAVTSAFQNASRRPPILLQASAVGCYGLSGDETVDENSPYGNDYLAGICKDWEASTKPVEEMGVRRVILRSGLVLDKRAGALAKLLLPYQLFTGGPLGSGRQWWPWIHLKDQILAMEYLLQNEQAAGIFNIMAPNPVTMNEFGRCLGQVLHRPHWAPVPAFALKLLLGEMSIMVLEGQRAIPKRLVGHGFQFKFEQLKPALEDVLTKG